MNLLLLVKLRLLYLNNLRKLWHLHASPSIMQVATGGWLRVCANKVCMCSSGGRCVSGPVVQPMEEMLCSSCRPVINYAVFFSGFFFAAPQCFKCSGQFYTTFDDELKKNKQKKHDGVPVRRLLSDCADWSEGLRPTFSKLAGWLPLLSHIQYGVCYFNIAIQWKGFQPLLVYYVANKMPNLLFQLIFNLVLQQDFDRILRSVVETLIKLKEVNSHIIESLTPWKQDINIGDMLCTFWQYCMYYGM